jgi:TolA-binding protein
MNRNILAAIICLFFVTASGIVHAQGTRESDEFKLAVDLFDDGLYAQAEDQFRSFIDRFPNSASAVEARFYLGDLQRRSKKYGEARRTFQDFALRYKDHPKAPDAWWNLGEIYALEHNYAEAGEAFAKLRSFHPKSPRAPEALLQASIHFLRVGDTENARTVLNAILLEYPRSGIRFEAQMQLGRLYLVQGEYERALREFSRLLAEAIPAAMRAEVVVSIGETQAGLGNRSEAEGRYREVISTYPATDASVRARVKLGDLQRSFRDYASARESYSAAADEKKSSPALRQLAFVGLAETAAAEADHASALQSWTRLFDSAGETGIEPEFYRKAAATARLAGAYAQAERWLEQLYSDTLVSTDRRVLLVELAETAREGKNFSAALARYRTYMQRFPDDVGLSSALLAIAEIEERELQNYTSALEHYAGVIERFGQTRVSDDAQFGRARTLEQQGALPEAAEAYRQVFLQYPASELCAEARNRHDRLLRRGVGDAHRTVEQLAAVIAAIHESPGNAEVDLLLARVYLEEIGDFVRAEKYFDAALRKGVSGEQAEEAAAGAATASLRLAQGGKRALAEAETRCNAFFAAYPSGARSDALGWELFMAKAVGASPTDVFEAASAFLARNPASNRQAALVAAGMAQVELGQYAAAEKDFTTVIETAAATEEGVDAWYGRARARAMQRAFEDAIQDLNAYETRAPNGRYVASAQLLLGRLLARVGRYEASVAAYDGIASRFLYAAVADSARLALLGVLAESGRAQDAVSRSEQYLRTADENPFRDGAIRQQYLFAHAVALAAARERSRAKRALLRYAEEFSSGAELGAVYFALGQMYRDEGKIDLASAYLQQAATMKGGGAALRDAADLLLESGRHQRAISAYERLGEKAVTPVERQYAQSRIVVALYRDGKIDEAKQKADAFRSAWPDAEAVREEFLLEHGKYFFRKGDYRAASDAFDDVEDSDVRELAALGMYWNGRCLEAQSKNADARSQYDDVIKDFARTGAALDAMMSLARMSMRAEKYQDAATQFKAVVDVGDIPEATLKEALNGLITCYDALSMYDVAAEMTRRFIDAWPGDPTSFRKRVNLGVYLYQLRYFDTAIPHLESLLADATPDDQAEIRYYIGESYFYKQDFTQAALEFLKVPYLVVGKTEIDWVSSSYHMAAQSYKNLSKFDLAIDMYQKILDSSGVDPRFRAQAEKEIKEIRALMK